MSDEDRIRDRARADCKGCGAFDGEVVCVDFCVARALNAVKPTPPAPGSPEPACPPGKRCTRFNHAHHDDNHLWTQEREALWVTARFNPMVSRCTYVAPACAAPPATPAKHEHVYLGLGVRECACGHRVCSCYTELKPGQNHCTDPAPPPAEAAAMRPAREVAHEAMVAADRRGSCAATPCALGYTVNHGIICDEVTKVIEAERVQWAALVEAARRSR